MKPLHNPRASVHESIEARAAAWLAQRDDGLTEAEAQEFAAWRADDPRHEDAVVRLEMTWGALQRLHNFRPEARQHPDRDLLAPSKEDNVVAFPIRPVLAAAAAVAMAVTSFFYWDSLKTPENGTSPVAEVVADHYATTAGGYQRATLPDGSVVELNENSEMSLAFSGTERRVILRRGEIHFTVTKDVERPFIVEANKVDVRAVGTAFNVRIKPEEVQVLVTEGKVSLHESAPGAKLIDGVPLMLPGDLVVVRHGSGGFYSQIEHLNETAINDALSWQGSRLVFVDTPLSEVISQFNSRNKVQIQIADPELAGFLVGGSFQAENIEAFVRLIASNQGIQVNRPSPDVVILEQTP